MREDATENVTIRHAMPLRAQIRLFGVRAKKTHTIEMNQMRGVFRNPNFCFPRDILNIVGHNRTGWKRGYINKFILNGFE